MPHLKIDTNIATSSFDEKFMKEMTATLATLTGKPEKSIMIEVNGGKLMSFSGTLDPTAHVLYTSIGKIDAESNSTYAAVIFKVLNGKGIPSDRVYIEFFDLKPDMAACNNLLFTQFLKTISTAKVGKKID